MGLTIHYHLRTEPTRPEVIRALVESLREIACDLPFQEVGDVLEFQGREADFERTGRQDEHRWFKIQAGSYFVAGGRHESVKPLHVIGFSTQPGLGCEPANFGFCRYPAFITVPAAVGRQHQLATGLEGWSWSSFCKTQYASNPECGGVQNFLRCHLCVVKFLDVIGKTTQVTVEVHDEGGYWDQRDLAQLAREVGAWNEFLAAFAGQLGDQLALQGIVVESAISGFADFEHLEARGLDRLRQRMNEVR